MCSLQVIDPLCGASGALALAAEVEGEEGDGEHDEGVTRRPPGPRPGEEPDCEASPHQRRPRVQSSTRAQTASAMPQSARVMNSHRSESR